MESTQRTKPDRQFTVKIEKLVYGGDGLARVDGQVVLTPFVLPGEDVLVTTRSGSSGLLRGTALEILQPARGRVIPRCEYFAHCGGCHYQHAEYLVQLREKCEILRETFRRTAGFELEREIKVVSGEPWFYRNRIQLHFAGHESGFLKAGSHELCGIDHCYISSPTIVDVIEKLAHAAKRPEWPTFLRSLEVFTNERDVQVNILESTRPVAARFFEFLRDYVPGLAVSEIEYSAGGFPFRVSRRSFFQVNRHLIEQLVDEVVLDEGGDYAIDLYAGVGLFSLPLASRFASVDAVERGSSAFRDLEWNCRESETLRTLQTAAEEFLKGVHRRPDLVIADPPRAGLGHEVVQEILRLRPARLTIVSCDVATLARDLKKLISAYELSRVALVDLFPQTYHFETVVHLAARR
jgi:23S rRNA (uracil1939-C5)-methyltransferase